MSLLSKLRCAFTLGQGVLIENKALITTKDPIQFFNTWLKEAEDTGVVLPESMSVSTCTVEGRPSSRMVLLKEVDQEGFVFFTNYGSRKAGELEENPFAALLFHWNILQRQVRIEGKIERVSHAESEAYFHSRGRGSQIGAWASKQSQVLDERQTLVDSVKYYEEKFAGQTVPLPDFWGGYRVIPEKIEFWQGKADRLHDRFTYTKSGQDWIINRLNP
ncbi:pyridoxamine 5'-phosphate oxidase [Psychromonas sp. 14N.309.X.WAT.B.A12]|uniref:pyridoxamine 5'-phosphate oxidase n=1 Tax=unclassified Psychromonas TaxID=2614957 RepID=UPI0025B1AFC6|nr:pyridoxamine 5'-phosphate oxidase [Psychromonas sp. 14N.309.X.WAT.B.A12]MDN2662031.1 pyridoxamine 5'-phosphate oxidase [Psychromonas sp. 14N.309.X.WAT.B.A12]